MQHPFRQRFFPLALFLFKGGTLIEAVQKPGVLLLDHSQIVPDPVIQPQIAVISGGDVLRNIAVGIFIDGGEIGQRVCCLQKPDKDAVEGHRDQFLCQRKKMVWDRIQIFFGNGLLQGGELLQVWFGIVVEQVGEHRTVGNRIGNVLQPISFCAELYLGMFYTPAKIENILPQNTHVRSPPR